MTFDQAFDRIAREVGGGAPPHAEWMSAEDHADDQRTPGLSVAWLALLAAFCTGGVVTFGICCLYWLLYLKPLAEAPK